MDKFLRLVLIYLFLPLIGFSQDYVRNRIIVRFKPEVKNLFQWKSDLENQLNRPFNLKQIFPEQRASNFRKSKSINHVLSRYFYLNFDDSIGENELLSVITHDREVEYAQLHYLPKLAAVPDDSLINLLRVHHELIGLYNAWDLSKGDTSVIIGIVDSGTDLDHPDLVQNLSINHEDPINGVDDDGDGFIDNYYGWDVAENDNNPQVLKSSHGVHMCGLVSAVPNNRIGVAGIGYNCRFLPVKIADDATGALIAAYEGVKYAADAGVDIINCSWGGYNAGEFERDIIDYAINKKNCLIIGAVGNDDDDRIFYPAAFENVLAVSSTDTNDLKAFNSNYNSLVDISAPGVSLVSTWDNGLYQSNTGTSVASAVVAGGAGLVKAYFPQFSNSEIRNYLKLTSDYIDLKNPAYRGKLGRGRLNLDKALNGELTPEFKNVTFKYFPNPLNSEQINLKLYWYLTQDAEVEVTLINSVGKTLFSLVDGSFDAGIYEEEFDLGGLASGLYILRYSSSGQNILEKLIIE